MIRPGLLTQQWWWRRVSSNSPSWECWKPTTRLPVTFYGATGGGTLSYCIMPCHAEGSEENRRVLQMVICLAQSITGSFLLSPEDTTKSSYLSKAENLINNLFYPGGHLFGLLPSSWQYRSHETIKVLGGNYSRVYYWLRLHACMFFGKYKCMVWIQV